MSRNGALQHGLALGRGVPAADRVESLRRRGHMTPLVTTDPSPRLGAGWLTPAAVASTWERTAR